MTGRRRGARQGEDYERAHPVIDGKVHYESNYNLLYDLASRYHSSEIQGVGGVDEVAGSFEPGGVVDAGVEGRCAQADADGADTCVA